MLDWWIWAIIVWAIAAVMILAIKVDREWERIRKLDLEPCYGRPFQTKASRKRHEDFVRRMREQREP